MKSYDAVVVGSGPNGLAAAIALAKSNQSVIVLEAEKSFGGGARTEELTLPGFHHDVCSAVYPLGIASPFFRALELERFGLDWVIPEIAAAHPLDGPLDGPLGGEDAVFLHNSIAETSRGLGRDGLAYESIMTPLANSWEELFREVLQSPLHVPSRPFMLANFGLKSILSADMFARKYFRDTNARALFAGIAAHANAPLDRFGTAAIGLMLNLAAHARGWPIPRGGARSMTDALVKLLESHGGEIEGGRRISSLKELPPSRRVFFDTSPSQAAQILSGTLSNRHFAKLNAHKHGPGIFKIDWALSEPIPWKSPRVGRAVTVHIGGTLEEICAAESLPSKGLVADKPYVLLAQPSLFDQDRAPAGRQVGWSYCHVPHGSKIDMTDAIEKQVERFAPGFRDVILARKTLNTSDIHSRNANMIGGDISGGALSMSQLIFGFQKGLNPYRLPVPGFYLCSSSTPPGPGVHGMCGFGAVKRALNDAEWVR